MKIYIASSISNPYLDDVIYELRVWGHLVYDFRMQPTYLPLSEKKISVDETVKILIDDRAKEAFFGDKRAIDNAEVCILVLPSGRSSHVEAGYMKGQDKKVVVLQPGYEKIELMYLLFDGFCRNIRELNDLLESLQTQQ